MSECWEFFTVRIFYPIYQTFLTCSALFTVAWVSSFLWKLLFLPALFPQGLLSSLSLTCLNYMERRCFPLCDIAVWLSLFFLRLASFLALCLARSGCVCDAHLAGLASVDDARFFREYVSFFDLIVSQWQAWSGYYDFNCISRLYSQKLYWNSIPGWTSM